MGMSEVVMLVMMGHMVVLGMECGSYRGTKLLEHAMKVVERIFEHRIRQQIKLGNA